MPKPKVIHSEHNRGLLYIICSVLAVIILGLCPSSSGAHADNVDFSVTIAPSLNVTIPTDVVSLNLNPANSAFSSQDLTVSVGTNNITGYTLTMTANSTDLTRTEAVGSTTPTISTLANEVAENEFTANRWGYRFSDNTTNTNYQPFATSIPFNESDSAVNNDARTITFGAKVNTEQAPGTYELALVFTAVANPGLQSLVINFDEGVESVAVKTGSATGTTVGTVSTSGGAVNGLAYNTAYYLVPTYASGKGLSAWSQPSGTVGTLSCVATSTCDTDETPYYTTGDGANAVTLASQDVTYIQDLTLAQCQQNVGTNGNGANVGDIIDVVDKRDKKEYTVRYINGACWMTQNLRYVGDTGSASGKMNMLASTSNITTDKTGDNALSYRDLTSGDTYDSARIHVGSNNYTNGETVWYNYAAASAGTITGSSNSTYATQDICPKGWKLPVYGSSTKEAGSIRSITSYTTAFSPVYGGVYYSGSLHNASTDGGWWSATANGDALRYELSYYSGSLSTANDYRRNGRYVRCVRSA